MMTNFNHMRRSYEDGYDGPEQRPERPFDPRDEQRGQSFEPRGQSVEGQGHSFERPPREGDWMREPRWREEQERREEQHRREEHHYGTASMVKVIEVLAQSPHSWEDATRRAVAEASRTIRGIRSVYVQDMQAIVENDQVVCFRINAKISFALEENRRRR
jgi:dodecin